jgi:hypothetical protein
MAKQYNVPLTDPGELPQDEYDLRIEGSKMRVKQAVYPAAVETPALTDDDINALLDEEEQR